METSHSSSLAISRETEKSSQSDGEQSDVKILSGLGRAAVLESKLIGYEVTARAPKKGNTVTPSKRAVSQQLASVGK